MIEVISDPGFTSNLDGEVFTVFYVKLEDTGHIEAEEAMEQLLQQMQFLRSVNYSPKCNLCSPNTWCTNCESENDD